VTISQVRRKAGGTVAAAPPAMSEDDFKARIMDTAKWHGWRTCHIRPARKQNGQWVTPIEGHAGLPDLVLARDGRVLLIELKSEVGTATDDQIAWLLAAGDNGHLWKPSDWPKALALLSEVRQ
jgi:hypothetical protein